MKIERSKGWWLKKARLEEETPMSNKSEYERNVGSYTHNGVGYSGLQKGVSHPLSGRQVHSGVGYGGLYE